MTCISRLAFELSSLSTSSQFGTLSTGIDILHLNRDQAFGKGFLALAFVLSLDDLYGSCYVFRPRARSLINTNVFGKLTKLTNTLFPSAFLF